MGLETRDRKFFLDGRELRLVSGAMHYFRVMPEYWRHRMLQMRAAGLNCLETYCPWNLHEEVKGEFNFQWILDVRKYVEIAKEVGLYVLLRPGPYICTEWDFGGLPSWLLSDPNMKVRSSYKPYMEASEKYLEKIFEQVKDLQYSNGGAIIAFQLENEYGSYGDDMEYKLFLKDVFTKNGMKELYFTSDNGTGIQKGQIPGVLMTSNFQEKEHGLLMFEYLRNIKQPDMPHMVMEFWSGWFDHWGEKHHVWPLEEYEKVLTWILQQGSSVNFYMFHGGTNFGFMNGANEGLGATNEGAKEPYMSDITSYDYDSLVSESGELTPKWHATKRILQTLLPQQVPATLPEPPQTPKPHAYGELKMEGCLKWGDILSSIKGIPSEKPVAMEMLPINNGGGQGYGFTLYRSKVNGGGKLKFTGRVRDRAVVLVDGKEVGVVEMLKPKRELDLNLSPGDHELDIIVENLARVNYADFGSPVLNDQRKGLQDPVLLNGKEITGWTIFPLEFKSPFVNSLSESEKWSEIPATPATSPIMYRATLSIPGEPQDTFINMKGWSKGNVFVNGYNLGRYWDLGPTETLYLPGPLLRQGDNQILIFEQHPSQSQTSVRLEGTPALGETVEQKTIIPTDVKAMITLLKAAIWMGPWTWNVLRLFMK